MSTFRAGLLALAALVPLAASAGVTIDELPEKTVWYIHVDLDKLRTTESGKILNQWIQWEVYDEIDEELGIDLKKEVDRFTAFSDSTNGTAIIIDGPVTEQSRRRILAIIGEEKDAEPREHRGREYFRIGDDEAPRRRDPDPFDDLEDTSYFSFALQDRIIITATEGYMQALLDNGGKVAGAGSHDGALLVLSANQALVQAGIQTNGLLDADDGDDHWESNIIRNTEQAVLVMADESGQVAIEAQLVSTDPKMAEAIGAIVNGLISLQAFNSELGPELQGFIRNTKVEVRERILSISTVVDPAVVVSVLDD